MRLLPVVAVASLAFAGSAGAQAIYTGGVNGAYHGSFCPPLAKELGQAYYNMACTPTAGTVENVTKILAQPGNVGFGQFDVLALMAAENPDVAKKIQVIRDDVAKECMFVITNNERLVSIDDLGKYASRIPFVLPPKGSGSAATFELLQRGNPEGLGKASNVTYAASVDDMIKRVLDSPNAVGLFVQLPDPGNAVFKTIAARKGRFVSVINRNLLNMKVGDRAVYVPVKTDVEGISVIEPKGGPLTTTCTSTVIFTGKAELFPEANNARKNQSDMIAAVTAMDRAKLVPATATGATAEMSKAWAWLKAKTTIVTAATVDGITKATDAARKKIGEL